jgi:cation transport ATPase
MWGTNQTSDVDRLLARPPHERQREHRYRFAQALVFGVPVLALQWFGRRLGGEEQDRWIGLLQALLTGWIVYVGAAGMAFEGILLLRRRVTGGLLIGLAVIGTYLLSLASWVHLLFRKTYWPTPPLFHVAVLLVLLWTGGAMLMARSTTS